jgi:hypothetical protein
MDQDPIVPAGGGGELLGGRRKAADINLIASAVRRRWPVPPETAAVVIDRLTKIVQKQTVGVMTKEGPADLEGPADANANAAARVLVAMEAQNQADDHLDDKNARLDAGKATENTVTEVKVRVPGLNDAS